VDKLYVIAMIAVISLVTVLLRFLPFWIFGKKRTVPPFVAYLGRVLPPAAMGMLVVYCLRDLAPLSYPYGLPQLIACVAVVLLHVLWRNTLVSILGGTVTYMLLLQLVF